MQKPIQVEQVSHEEWSAIEAAMSMVPSTKPAATNVVSSRPVSGAEPQSVASNHAPLNGSSPHVSNPPIRPVSAPARMQVFAAPLPPRNNNNGAVMNHQAPINLSLWDRHRFMISAFPAQLFAFLKNSVCGSVHNADLKCFHFPLKEYDAFVQTLRQMHYAVIHEIPATVKETVFNHHVEKCQLDMSALPETLQRDLFPFQKEGVEFVVARNGRGMIADEMGLGKTVQAIALAAYYRQDWPLLVVCPSSLRMQWGQQFMRWIPHEEHNVNILMNAKGSVNALINIISFNAAAKMGPEIAAKQFKMIIVDESHYLKNMKSKRSQVLIPLLQRTKRCILLSGTPALSRPQELYSQINALCPKLFPNFGLFGTRYCAARMCPWGWDYSGSSNPRELNAIISTMMIRRKKDEVLDQLPEKTRQRVLLHVDMKAMDALQGQIKDLRVAAEEMHKEDRSHARDASNVRMSVFFDLFRNTGRIKVPAVVEYLLDQLGEEKIGPKFLVFAHHLDVMDGIEEGLKKHDVILMRIDGKTPAMQRQNYVDFFQNTPECRIALLSITAAGVGLTLTAASQVVFAELFFNPGALLQAEDRAHRIGQQNRVWVYYLVARNSLDEQLFRLLNRKISVLGETLDGVSGKKLDIKGGEVDRQVETEKLKEITEDSFVSELLRMIHVNTHTEAKEPDGKKQRVEVVPEVEVDTDSILQKTKALQASAASKFSGFAFPKKQ